MPVSGYFDTPFAVGGDLNPIPDATQPSGTVSYEQGFPIGYSTPVGSGGFNVPRTAFNQVLNDITTAAQNWQQNTVAPFITTAMNGGTPYSYPANVLVLNGGVVYQSLVGSNTDTPPSAKWAVLNTAVGVQSSFKHLTAGWASNTTVSVLADVMTLTNTQGSSYLAKNFSLTLNSATSGAGGLDTGSLASGTWYFIYVIYNGTTANTLMSASSTSPTLPAGYTYQSGPIGAVRTDGSSHFIGFKQVGRNWQYQVGSNLSGLPAIITGSSGSVSTPTWTSTAISSVAPTTAGAIDVVLFNDANGVGTNCMAAPNNSYGAAGSTSNPPPLTLGTPGTANGSLAVRSRFVLESGNIYYASGASATGLACAGFELNI